jgi:hypothetical protein
MCIITPTPAKAQFTLGSFDMKDTPVHEDHLAKEDRPKKVFTSNVVDPKTRNSSKSLNKSEQYLVDGYKTMLWKIAYNENPKYRHVGARCEDLNSWAEKFKTGYPWKNNERLVRLGTPELVATAIGLSSRLESIEKVKNGRDIGRVDG